MSQIPTPAGSRIPTKPKICTTTAVNKENQSKQLLKKNVPKTNKVTFDSINVPKLALAIKKPIVKAKYVSEFNSKRATQTTTAKLLSSVPEVAKKPLKRLAAPVNEVKPKVFKPNPAKPAPYDFKARFHLLKEAHDNLKTAYASSKEKLGEITTENEELTLTNERLKGASDELLLLRPRLTTLETENTELRTQLQARQQNLTTALEKLDKIKAAVEEKSARLNILIVKNEELSADLEKYIKLSSDLKEEVHSLDANRRILHNEIQDLKGNIRVFCRVRPHLPTEQFKLLSNIHFTDEKSLEISKGKESIGPSGRPTINRFAFTFDKVFAPHAGQQEVFSELSQLVRSALDGYNVCVFAYGQTGSGKTYTMEGDQLNSGMIPRAIDAIFDSLEQLKKIDWAYTVKASFLEIYNENIVDLLSPNKNQHEIRMTDRKGTDVYVTNLSVQTISNAEELKYYMTIAQRNRAVAATENNERSSRSHSVTKIVLEGMNPSINEKYTGSLNLVDLAGSERINITDASRSKETQNINRSLSNLGNCILSLIQKQDHIPYRNSKLTHLLMPCLGGNSKTLMLVNVAPFEDCYNETINSLRFASVVNQVRTGQLKKNKTVANSSSFH